jgi:hypothetical protein
MANTILLNSVGTTFLKEGPCSAAGDGVITPGDFIERTAAGEFRRTSAQGVYTKLVALENDLVSGEITDNYATEARVRAAYVQPGDEVYAQVAAGAAAIAIGDKLVIDTGGTVSKFDFTSTIADIALATGDTYTDAAVNTAVNTMKDTINQQTYVATALEAVDNAAGATKARIKIEIV